MVWNQGNRQKLSLIAALDDQRQILREPFEQRGVEDKGGTMRLGAYPCRLVEGSIARRASEEKFGQTLE